MCDDLKRDFLHDQIFSLVIAGGFQRGYVYGQDQDVDENNRTFLRNSIREFLDSLLNEYQNQNENELEGFVIDKVCELADHLTEVHHDMLNQNRFRIGTSQKIIGLYLKYMWVIGEIKTPPICPFDRDVIGVLAIDPRPVWTQFDDIETYRQLIEAARDKAEKDISERNVAKWELWFWQNRYSLDSISAAAKDYISNLNDDARNVCRKFFELGWFPSEDMDMFILVDYVNKTDNEIESGMIESHQKHLGLFLDNLLTVFPNRRALLESAFQAHKQKNYNASIPLFLAQVDGICQEWLGVKMFSKQKGVPITEAEIKDKDILTGSLLEAVVEPLKTGTAMMLNPKEMEARRASDPNYDILNRHEIMHGVNLDYGTEKNSLRAISLLNYLALLQGRL